jgi:hypothetical protein
MLGKIVRFDGEPSEDKPSAPSTKVDERLLAQGTTPRGQAGPGTVRRESGTPALAWMQQMIDQQTRLFEAAQRERAEALIEMRRVAQTVCQKSWDAWMRAGDDPEGWPPARLADLIIQSLQLELRNSALLQDPQLGLKYQQLSRAFSQSRLEIQNLRQRLQAFEQSRAEKRPEGPGLTPKRQAQSRAWTGSEIKRNSSQPIPPLETAQASPSPAAEIEFYVTENDRSVSARPGSGVERVDDVVRVIAEFGLCRWKDVTGYLAKKWNIGPSAAGTLDAVIKKTVALGLLYIEEVRLEWGGKPTGKMLILSEAGEQCAQSLGLQVVESQYARGLAAHKDASHFYAILEVAAILARYFTEVDCFPASIPMAPGRYLADLTAVTSEGERLFIVVERGTSKADSDRENKWVRAAAANGGLIYLATPNQDTLEASVSEIAVTREKYPEAIKAIKAFSVQGYRDQKDPQASGPWSFER